MADAKLVLGNLGDNVDARVRVGADFGPFIVNLVDSDDNAIDITGCTFGCEVKTGYKATTPNATMPVTIVNAANGVFTFMMDREDTRALKYVESIKDTPPYVWYLWMRDAQDREFPIYYGTFTVVWGSTAP